jgi:hypothetical protein
MTFIVEGVTKHDEPDPEVRRIGAYGTREEAIAVAKVTVDDFLRREHKAGMLPSELYSRYQEGGEHPFIFRDDDKTINVRTFDHFQYAMLRCAEICGGSK